MRPLQWMLVGLMLCWTATAHAKHDFDYYTLSLSWSPTYCQTSGQRDLSQCGSGRRFAFVVHGLWPQYERGWPQHCDTREKWVPNHQITSMLDIMPSKRLIIHEWRKHGTCAGLSQSAYFSLTRALFKKIRIPARYLSPQDTISTTGFNLIEDFLKTNRTLSRNMISVQCGNARGTARLRELRICFSKDGEFAACGANERRSCRAQTLILPPVR